MEETSLLTIVLAGAGAALLIFLFRPGIRAALERSRNAPKDWAGALVPIVLVVLFVVFLIIMVR